jgi:ABC-type Fe3+ transport system substrate-binding protein
MRLLWPTLFLAAVLALAFGPALLRHEPHYDEELVLISPHWDGIRSEFGRAFSEFYFKKTQRRIRMTWLDIGGSSEINKYVTERFKQAKERGQEGIGADLFFGGGMDILPRLAAGNCFEALRLPPELEQAIPAAVSGQLLRDKENRFFAACLSSFGFVYNREVIARAKIPEPKTWEDLGRPEFHGWISSGDPSLSGSLHQAFEIVLQSEGWEKGFATLGRMLSNARAFNEGGPSVPRDVSIGQAAAGPCIDFYATAPIRRQGATHLKLVVPEGASVVTPDGIALMRGAPNKTAAREFILFTLGEPGQRLWYQARGTPGGPVDYDLERLPVMPSIYDSGVATNTVVNPFKTKSAFIYDSSKSSERWSMLNQLMRAVWIDAHEELWSARDALIAAGRDEDLGALLCKPPISEKELLDIAARKPSADDINALKNKWTAWARESYGKVEASARR